jgi:acetyl esterase
VGLDPDLAAALTSMASSGRPPLHTASPARARRAYLRMTAGAWPASLVRDVDARDLTIRPGGRREARERQIPARLYRPRSPGPWPLIVYFHGGGWVIGDLNTHDNVLRSLCHDADTAIVAIDYRLAPEHPFPAAYDDAVAATRWAWRNRARLGGGAGFAVAGDSSGANLAAGVAYRYRSTDVAIDIQMLICPLLELTARHRSRQAFASGFLLDSETIAWFVKNYVSGRQTAALASDPRVCPAAYPATAGLKAALIVTAEFDPLRDEGEAYAARLAADGVPTALVRLPGMLHGFADFAHVSPAADRALRRCGSEFGRGIRGQVSRPTG